MENRKIGSLDVSIVGLGCNNFGWRLDYDRTVAVVDAALDAGINFFDTADIYGGTKSEEFLGRALEGRRDQVVLATKFGMKVDEQRKGAKPDYARRALEDSLRRLRTDHIDLYQLHQPDPGDADRRHPRRARRAGASGKVREIGCSNFSVEQLREAKAAAGRGAKFVSVQNEYSLLHREPERRGPRRVRARRARLPAVLPARQRPADRQIPARPAAARGHPPGRRGIAALPQRSKPRDRRGADRLRGIARPLPARARVLLAAEPPAGRLGDRRRDLSRTGAGQRQGRRLAAHPGRPRRDRRAGGGFLSRYYQSWGAQANSKLAEASQKENDLGQHFSASLDHPHRDPNVGGIDMELRWRVAVLFQLALGGRNARSVVLNEAHDA